MEFRLVILKRMRRSASNHGHDGLVFGKNAYCLSRSPAPTSSLGAFPATEFS